MRMIVPMMLALVACDRSDGLPNLTEIPDLGVGADMFSVDMATVDLRVSVTFWRYLVDNRCADDAFVRMKVYLPLSGDFDVTSGRPRDWLPPGKFHVGVQCLTGEEIVCWGAEDATGRRWGRGLSNASCTDCCDLCLPHSEAQLIQLCE